MAGLSVPPGLDICRANGQPQRHAPCFREPSGIRLVGTGRFELPTCRLGGDRSIHLSYVPTVLLIVPSAGPLRQCRCGSACRRSGSAAPPRRRSRWPPQVGARGRDAEHAAARRFEPAGRNSRSGLEHGRAGRFRLLDAGDRLAGRVGARISARRQHHAHARSGVHSSAVPREPALAAAISAGTKSRSMRCISGCVSGSPSRTLNSSTFGPSAVIISPA